MANTKSQEKRNRQNEKRRQKNTQDKSAIRTASKKVNKALDTKEKNAEELTTLFTQFSSTIDAAAAKRTLHKNTAARRKSRIAKKINNVLKQTQA
ncbi:MAG: 30S ribosomal protein S20 [Spirochaetae bacterium HGW-Spirochaetae-1]|nr:MAG: 30S ribosomal protein S20 [Spirochaetae bacterium HGW-Spirochaetae-1]